MKRTNCWTISGAALNDSPEKPAFIETVLGKGYRFIGAVVESDCPPATPAPASTNMFRKVAVLIAALAAVLVTAYYAGTRLTRPAVSISPVTVVVLPFQNLSSDPEQEYFSEGLTEETIAALGRATPSQSASSGARQAWRIKKQARPQPKSAVNSALVTWWKALSAATRSVSASRQTLIRVQDQVQVWGHSYDLTPSGLLEVQQQIGTAIARQVGGELSPRSGAARTFTQDPDAHDLYLRGRYYWAHRAPESIRKSVEYFGVGASQGPLVCACSCGTGGYLHHSGACHLG